MAHAKVAAVVDPATALEAPGPVAASVLAAVNAPEVADPARFRHAPSGRQTPAKRKYVERRRLGEWRLGESNRAGGTTRETTVEITRSWSETPYRLLPRVPATASLGDDSSRVSDWSRSCVSPPGPLVRRLN